MYEQNQNTETLQPMWTDKSWTLIQIIESSTLDFSKGLFTVILLISNRQWRRLTVVGFGVDSSEPEVLSEQAHRKVFSLSASDRWTIFVRQHHVLFTPEAIKQNKSQESKSEHRNYCIFTQRADFILLFY